MHSQSWSSAGQLQLRSTNSMPGQGSSAIRRLPSRSRWSQSFDLGGRDPEPDSIMQPSITPSPRARAACAMRTASRMPPLFASLMLIPWPAGAVGHRQSVHVLVDVDREGDSRFRPLASGRPRERLLDVLDSEPGQRRAPLERLVELPVLVHVDLQRQVGDAAYSLARGGRRGRPPAELELEPPEAPIGPVSARRAMSSGSPSQIVHEVAAPRSRPRSCQAGWPEELAREVVERGVRLAAWFPGSSAIRRRSPRARTDRRRALAASSRNVSAPATLSS